MRVALLLTISLLLGAVSLASCRQVSSDPDTPDDPSERLELSGFVFRNDAGRLELGQASFARSAVVERYVFSADAAAALEPVLSTVDERLHIWSLGGLDKAPEKQPRVLVHLRATLGPAATGAKEREVVQFHLVEIEFLPRQWLVAWRELAQLYRPLAFGNSHSGALSKPRVSRLAPMILTALAAMQESAMIDEQQRQFARGLAGTVVVANAFKSSVMVPVHRWLVKMEQVHGLRLNGLDRLGSLPPDIEQVTRWFVQSDDRATFLEHVRGQWKGSFSSLEFYYYVQNGPVTSFQMTTVRTVDREWSDDDYNVYQRITRDSIE